MAFALGERQMDRQTDAYQEACRCGLTTMPGGCRAGTEGVSTLHQALASVGAASQLVHVPSCHLASRRQPSETPAPSPRLCQGSPRAGERAARTGHFTPKPPEQRPGSHPAAGGSPPQQPPLPSAHPPEPAKHNLGKEPPNSFCPDGAIKSLVAIAGAPEHSGDRPAAQRRSPG